MVRIFAIPVLLMAWVMAASAEPASPPNESMPAQESASSEMLDAFAKSFATPTRLTGKIARWDSGICPLTVGQPPQYANFVTRRVKEVAAGVGAPVDAEQSCKPNIEIVFTTTPQALLDNVRQHQAEYLGYAESSTQKDKLATVTRPIQAWYTTLTKDLHGMSTIDSARRRYSGATLSCVTCLRSPFSTGLNPSVLDLPEATTAVEGSNISGGARSEFFHIIIVVDSNRLAGYQIGPLADYIAMLALAQLKTLDGCQPLPSIVNMLVSSCSQRATDITENDLAYLRGLYRMSPEKSLLFQQSEIANRMKESLGQ
jgi:hypothetical protein